MENHLLIGLGGTGGRVLAAFRKLMYERFNGEVKPKDLWLDYLYVDSSEQDLKMKDPAQWSVMGNNIALDADSIVKSNYSAPIEVSPIGMSDHLTVLQQQELHCISNFRSS